MPWYLKTAISFFKSIATKELVETLLLYVIDKAIESPKNEFKDAKEILHCVRKKIVD